jgi:hypothetical protein
MAWCETRRMGCLGSWCACGENVASDDKLLLGRVLVCAGVQSGSRRAIREASLSRLGRRKVVG